MRKDLIHWEISRIQEDTHFRTSPGPASYRPHQLFPAPCRRLSMGEYHTSQRRKKTRAILNAEFILRPTNYYPPLTFQPPPKDAPSSPVKREMGHR